MRGSQNSEDIKQATVVDSPGAGKLMLSLREIRIDNEEFLSDPFSGLNFSSTVVIPVV